jgi:hypothetical protein
MLNCISEQYYNWLIWFDTKMLPIKWIVITRLGDFQEGY